MVQCKGKDLMVFRKSLLKKSQQTNKQTSHERIINLKRKAFIYNHRRLL